MGEQISEVSDCSTGVGILVVSAKQVNLAMRDKVGSAGHLFPAPLTEAALPL